MRVGRKIVITISVALLALAAAAPGTQAANGPASYIVVLKDSVKSPKTVAVKHSKTHGAKVKNVYKNALKGYAAKLTSAEVAALRKDPKVKWIEPDAIARIVGKGKRPKPPKDPTPDPTDPPADPTCAAWGLDRVDQRSLPLSGTCGFGPTGAGVTAWVIDTGIRTNHDEFGGRASSAYDFVDNDSDASDCHGHGTHVAGTIGGATYGVAKAVRLKAVRVLDCSGRGYWSDIIDGIDWVVAHKTGRDVANMSLGGPPSAAVDTAVRNAISAGVTFAIAAGNNNRDACSYSPARVGPALTVAATTQSDARASYSNYGSCVDIFAPGSGIKSAWHTGTTATRSLSGTSMATPHVAGVAAQWLEDHAASPDDVHDALLGRATSGVVGNPGKKSPNELLFAY